MGPLLETSISNRFFKPSPVRRKLWNVPVTKPVPNAQVDSKAAPRVHQHEWRRNDDATAYCYGEMAFSSTIHTLLDSFGSDA